MTIESLSILTAIGIVLAFTMGFLFGTGCEQAENRRTIRRLKDRARKIAEQAYKKGREDAEAQRKQDINSMLDDLLAAKQEREEIKIGGF